MNTTFDKRLQHPFTAQMCGATSSGKSYMCREIIRAAHELIHPPPERIIYCYSGERERERERDI